MRFVFVFVSEQKLLFLLFLLFYNQFPRQSTFISRNAYCCQSFLPPKTEPTDGGFKFNSETVMQINFVIKFNTYMQRCFLASRFCADSYGSKQIPHVRKRNARVRECHHPFHHLQEGREKWEVLPKLDECRTCVIYLFPGGFFFSPAPLTGSEGSRAKCANVKTHQDRRKR